MKFQKFQIRKTLVRFSVNLALLCKLMIGKQTSFKNVTLIEKRKNLNFPATGHASYVKELLVLSYLPLSYVRITKPTTSSFGLLEKC